MLSAGTPLSCSRPISCPPARSVPKKRKKAEWESLSAKIQSDPDRLARKLAYQKQWYQDNKERMSVQAKERYQRLHAEKIKKAADYRLAKSQAPEKISRWREIHELDPTTRYIWDKFRSWKKAAPKRDLEWTITFEQMLELFAKSPCCAYTGKPLVREANSPWTASLDRIDSSRGYLIDNVVLCGAKVNKMKLDSSLDDFADIMSCALAYRAHWPAP